MVPDEEGGVTDSSPGPGMVNGVILGSLEDKRTSSLPSPSPPAVLKRKMKSNGNDVVLHFRLLIL